MTAPKTSSRYRINHEIRTPHVRLIDTHSASNQVLSLNDAFALAEERQLDLVEVQPSTDPTILPVCRLMDYGKFCYEQQKKEAELKRQRKNMELKEIQFRPVIQEHDYQTKIQHVETFVREGHRVVVVIKLKGREKRHTQVAQTLLGRLKKDLEVHGKLEDKSIPGQAVWMLMIHPTTSLPH